MNYLGTRLSRMKAHPHDYITDRGTTVEVWLDDTIRAWRVRLTWDEGGKTMTNADPIMLALEATQNQEMEQEEILYQFVLMSEKYCRGKLS